MQLDEQDQRWVLGFVLIAVIVAGMIVASVF
jgi:hypothetical protein